MTRRAVEALSIAKPTPRRLVVLSSRVRVALFLAALALLAVAGPISSASAIPVITGSQITSPSDPTYVLFNEATDTSTTVAFTVSGTVTGAASGEVDLRCYYGSKSYLLAEKVPVSGGAFSVPVEFEKLGEDPCVLRGVPTGDKEPYPPGSPSPFAGPRIAFSYFETYFEKGVRYDYEFEAAALSGDFVLSSVGNCGLYSQLIAPASLQPSYFFDCNAALYENDHPASGSSTRSELQIDGANAYGPATVDYLKITGEGAPQIAVTQSFESGLATVHEVDPMVECSPETIHPPNATTCKKFVSTGVELERTWQTSNADQVAWMTDTWRSTDGRSHTLSALYDQALVSAETKPGSKEWSSAYQFPGTFTFSPTTRGQMVSLPSGSAGAILYREDAATPDPGDSEHPQGAIVYDSPGEPLQFYRGSEEAERSGFEMPYQRTIPAGGSTTLRMAFVQAYALSEVQTLTKEVISSYFPTLTIASPANGTTFTTPSITVSGTASDTGQLSSVTVNGKAVAVGAGGAWSTGVTLNAGANTITAVASDEAGLVTPQSVSVTYAPPAPPAAHASQIGTVSGANGAVSFTISCLGASGTSCELESALTSTEKTKGGKPIGVSAKRHHGKTRSRTVSVASSKIVVPAGQKIKITLRLNAAGKSLLSKFGKLPAHLTVTLLSAGKQSTIISQNITIKPAKKAKKKHKHKH